MSSQYTLARQSVVVNAMRTMLLVLVVFVHVLPDLRVPVSPELSASSLYTLVSELISHNIGSFAVPAFFVFSGYFFFFSVGTGEPQCKWVLPKWKKRLRTLVVPYILWNLLLVLCIIVKNLAFAKMGLGEDDFIGQVRYMGVYGTMWGGPINFPLWYLRDLIVVVALAPLFYWMIEWLGYVAVALFALLYLSGCTIDIPGLSEQAITFFGFGAYFGLKKANMLEFCSKYKIASYIAAPVLLAVAVSCNAQPYHEWLIHLACIPSLVALVNIVSNVSDKVLATLAGLSPAVFFIYAIHEIYIVCWTKGAFVSVLGDSTLALWISYFAEPAVILAVCYGIYLLSRKFVPGALAVLTGGRLS